jgi:hypothetical protein
MNNTEENINDMINSLEGMQRATPGPFFFTRVSARLQREQRNSWQIIVRLIARPAIAITGLCVVLLINVWAVLNQSAVTASSAQNTEPALTDEYIIASNSLYYYENTSETR